LFLLHKNNMNFDYFVDRFPRPYLKRLIPI
jgi:hypothetical protein